MNSLEQHKLVKIFPDYAAEGVWCKEGYPAYLTDLPVSEELREEIRLMARFYETEQDYMPGIDIRHDYILWAYKIACKIKKELPEWTVQFCNSDNELGLKIPVVRHFSEL